MSERFISQPILPTGEIFDSSVMAVGEPGLPRQFKWDDRIIEVRGVLRTWRETGKCRHGSPERYVRKHWFEVDAGDGITMKIYFDRQPRQGARGPRWWLFSIRDSKRPPS